MSIDLSYETIEVVPEKTIDVEATHPVEVVQEAQDSTITGMKKEYSIVGDAVYTSRSSDDVPEWLSNLINNTVNTSIANGMQDYDSIVQDVRNAIDSIDVAKNTFVSQVDVTHLVDGVIVSRLETQNATYENNFATKVDLTTTVATSEMALAQDISDMRASFNDLVDGRITDIDTILATETGVLTDSIKTLESTFAVQEGEVLGLMEAATGFRTYLGLDPNGDPDGTGLIDSVASLSEFYVDMYNEVETGFNTVNSSLAQLKVDSKAYADRVESKFLYDSKIEYNNKVYYSGFGLKATAGGSGTTSDPYNSEFWINAQRFRFTNTNGTGSVSPFTIDATGSSPQVTFNGKVSFSNVYGTPDFATASEVNNAISNAPYVLPAEVAHAINTNTTTIHGSRITTGTVTASKIASNAITANKISSNAITARELNAKEINANHIITEGISIVKGYRYTSVWENTEMALITMRKPPGATTWSLLYNITLQIRSASGETEASTRTSLSGSPLAQVAVSSSGSQNMSLPGYIANTSADKVVVFLTANTTGVASCTVTAQATIRS